MLRNFLRREPILRRRRRATSDFSLCGCRIAQLSFYRMTEDGTPSILGTIQAWNEDSYAVTLGAETVHERRKRMGLPAVPLLIGATDFGSDRDRLNTLALTDWPPMVNQTGAWTRRGWWPYRRSANSPASGGTFISRAVPSNGVEAENTLMVDVEAEGMTVETKTVVLNQDAEHKTTVDVACISGKFNGRDSVLEITLTNTLLYEKTALGDIVDQIIDHCRKAKINITRRQAVDLSRDPAAIVLLTTALLRHEDTKVVPSLKAIFEHVAMIGKLRGGYGI